MYRVYREGEVDKIRYCYSIKRKTRYDILETPSRAAEIDVYDAEVEGRVRTVHYYRDTKVSLRIYTPMVYTHILEPGVTSYSECIG